MAVDATNDHRTALAEKMRNQGIGDASAQTFLQNYGRLAAGAHGYIPEKDITPVESVPRYDELEASGLEQSGRDAIRFTVHILLNGGLGTSMGLAGPKAFLRVKQNLSFLDIILEQAKRLKLQVLFMHSAATRQACLPVIEAALTKHAELPVDFVQAMVPKIDAADLGPATWPSKPAMEWCPPGHGDLYPSLYDSGILEALLAAGLRYAFISNVDNLGANLDPLILGHMIHEHLDFLMEVAVRTPADSKGGHLATTTDGRLILRERSQCPDEDLPRFEDVSRHRFFNTNNLWIDLRALHNLLQKRNGVLDLPLIRNKKSIDPRQPDSPKVFQLETAAGAAIGAFEYPGAVLVPRGRFSPVKTTDDLLALRSDAYVLTTEFQCRLDPKRHKPPTVRLDRRSFAMISDFERRFPAGAPSLIECEELEVSGDVTFGKGVVIKGNAHIRVPDHQAVRVPSGSVITGSWPPWAS